MKQTQIHLSLCSNRTAYWGNVLTVQDATQYAADRGISTRMCPRLGESLICRARQNDLVVFMESDCDYLISIDDDVEIPTDTFMKMIEADRDIVGGVYRIKTAGEYKVAQQTLDRSNISKAIKEKLLMPGRYASAGCMCIKRSCIEDMIKAYPDLEYEESFSKKPAWALYQPFVYKKDYLSEDWAFCKRARDIGKEVWIHGGILCHHWGTYRYSLEAFNEK